MLSTNDVLQERYRIIRPLGQGGMGAVYEAIDERFGEPIALKEVLFEINGFADDGRLDLMTKAFEREAKSLAKARHEVIPYVRDYFSELNRQYLVMELVEGDDLARLLAKRNEPFQLNDVLNWMYQLLDALDYLHNLNPPIIHRDIKPQNLKLNFRRKIKLLDFGIAKSLDNGSFTITNQTFVGATLNYSPIEQILRVMNATFREYILLRHKAQTERILSQNTDCRSDIYALGATFYHLLTNAPPTDVVKRTLEVWEGRPDPLPNPTELNPEISANISACLLKALSIERDDRFSSAVEMHAALSSRPADASLFDFGSPLATEIDPKSAVPPANLHKATQAETERLLDWKPDKKRPRTPSNQVSMPPRPRILKDGADGLGQVPPKPTQAGLERKISEAWYDIPHPAGADAAQTGEYVARPVSDPTAVNDWPPAQTRTDVRRDPVARSPAKQRSGKTFWLVSSGLIALFAIVSIVVVAFVVLSSSSSAVSPSANFAEPTPEYSLTTEDRYS